MPATTSYELPGAQWRARFRRRLLTWFRKHARELPWRETNDPYNVWVSEIMLQQTQVETVIPYYAKFLAAFPNIKALAAATESKVFRQWEGLGYYRRARQMHAAAKKISKEHDGKFPTDLDAVYSLPGVGRYTAGAVLSLAMGQRHPILEANTIRLFSRLLGYREDPTKSAGQKLLWEFAESILPRSDVGRVNQAAMELGSLVCTPRNPSCTECPVAMLCAARLAGNVEDIPPAKKKMQYTKVTEAAVVVRSRGRVFVRQCAMGERWAGLWDFPRMAVTAKQNARLVRELAAGVMQQTGLAITVGDKISTIRHGVTRYRITLHCFTAELSESANQQTRRRKTQRWIEPQQLAALPLSVTGRKISQLIQ